MHPVPAERHSEINEATGGFSRARYPRIFRRET
jgi:hypothetical protein